MTGSIFPTLTQSIIFFLSYIPTFHRSIINNITGILTSFLLFVSGKDINKTIMYKLYLTEHTLDAYLSIIDFPISEQGMVQTLPCTKERSSVQ